MAHTDHRLPRLCRPLLATALLLPLMAACSAPPVQETQSLDSRLRLTEKLDDPAAMQTLREAAARNPRDAALQERMAVAAERGGQEAEAAQSLRNVIALQGPDPQRLMTIGRLELRAGNPAAAIDAYGQARAQSPSSVTALAGLGLAYDLAGDQVRAQESYRAALALSPRDWSIRANLAMSLMLSGGTREAVDVLADAEFAPDAPRRARHNLALALSASGRPGRTVRLLRLDMGPTEATAMAQEMAEVALKIDPTAVPIRPRYARRVVTEDAAAARLGSVLPAQQDVPPPVERPQPARQVAEAPAAP